MPMLSRDNHSQSAISQPRSATGTSAPYRRYIKTQPANPSSVYEPIRHVLHTLDFNDNDASKNWKLCVPTDQRQRVLTETHNAPTAGHLGIAKTLARLSRCYYWPKMMRDAARFVRSCNSCQRFKTQQKQRAVTCTRPT